MRVKVKVKVKVTGEDKGEVEVKVKGKGEGKGEVILLCQGYAGQGVKVARQARVKVSPLRARLQRGLEVKVKGEEKPVGEPG
jgi:hypothetical protein